LIRLLQTVDACTHLSVLPACEVNRWFASDVHPHEPALRAYLRGRFPSLTDVDDVIQEAYLRIIRVRAHGGIRSPKSMLFVIARNLAVDVFRRKYAMPTDDLVNIERIPDLIEEHGATGGDIHDQELELLEEAVLALPERCRQVILLKKFKNLSYDEISKLLGISRHTISAHTTTGMMKCRDYLRAHGAHKDCA